MCEICVRQVSQVYLGPQVSRACLDFQVPRDLEEWMGYQDYQEKRETEVLKEETESLETLESLDSLVQRETQESVSQEFQEKEAYLEKMDFLD